MKEKTLAAFYFREQENCPWITGQARRTPALPRRHESAAHLHAGRAKLFARASRRSTQVLTPVRAQRSPCNKNGRRRPSLDYYDGSPSQSGHLSEGFPDVTFDSQNNCPIPEKASWLLALSIYSDQIMHTKLEIQSMTRKLKISPPLHLGSIWEAFGKHLGSIWEAFCSFDSLHCFSVRGSHAGANVFFFISSTSNLLEFAWLIQNILTNIPYT